MQLPSGFTFFLDPIGHYISLFGLVGFVGSNHLSIHSTYEKTCSCTTLEVRFSKPRTTAWNRGAHISENRLLGQAFVVVYRWLASDCRPLFSDDCLAQADKQCIWGGNMQQGLVSIDLADCRQVRLSTDRQRSLIVL